MTAIVSPRPRRASLIPLPALERPAPLLSPPIYPSSDLSRSTGLFSPPRLMSPINITGNGPNKPNLSKSSASCSTTKRRRTAATNSRSSRRRHCTRPDCTLGYNSPAAAFDQLPWISQVEAAPERVDVWDIADLSLLPDARLPDLTSDSGIGPVRRRKTSLRSSQSHSDSHHSRSHLSALPMQMLDRREVMTMDDPRTPPPMRFDPREVTFLNLMPVLPSSGVEGRPSPKVPVWSRTSSPSPM